MFSVFYVAGYFSEERGEEFLYKFTESMGKVTGSCYNRANFDVSDVNNGDVGVMVIFTMLGDGLTFVYFW